MNTELASRRAAVPAGRPVAHRAQRLRDRAVLRDGSEVLIRPVRPDDATLLADGFDRLGPRSRRFRFLTAKNHLSSTELRSTSPRSTSTITRRSARSIPSTDVGSVSPATSAPPSTGRSPGSRSPSSTSVAGTRAGSALLARLTNRAPSEGIRRFTALVAVDNQAVFALLRSLPGDLDLVGHGHGALEYKISLLGRKRRRRWLPAGRPRRGEPRGLLRRDDPATQH